MAQMVFADDEQPVEEFAAQSAGPAAGYPEQYSSRRTQAGVLRDGQGASSASLPRRRRTSGQMARCRLGRLGAPTRSPSLRIALPRPCTELVRSSLPDLSAVLRRQYLSGKPQHLLSKREDSDG